MARRRHYQKPEEDHPDETWLIPYSDILTLLLALFIVLFASAQVDQKKFEQIRMAFSDAFSGNVSFFEGSKPTPQITDTPQKASPMEPITPGQETKEQAFMQESAQLAQAKQMLDRYIRENGLTDQLDTVLGNDGLMIVIKDTALYHSGSAELLPESQRFAAEIAKMLVPLTQRVTISGHTDNVPINTAEFPTNWDLSSKRALNFMKYLLAKEPSLQPTRFNATGFGEYHPVIANDSEDGRAKNRRVEVLIMRNYRAANSVNGN